MINDKTGHLRGKKILISGKRKHSVLNKVEKSQLTTLLHFNVFSFSFYFNPPPPYFNFLCTTRFPILLTFQ